MLSISVENNFSIPNKNQIVLLGLGKKLLALKLLGGKSDRVVSYFQIFTLDKQLG